MFNKEKIQSLNDFLNIKDIKDNYLYTLDGQVIIFIKVNPINIELLSDEELESKMDSNAIEFSNEQYPYKILVIPRAVDIQDLTEYFKRNILTSSFVLNPKSWTV